jgi:hypothetical protein
MPGAPVVVLRACTEREAHLLGLLWWMGAGCIRRANIQLRHPRDRHHFRDHQCRCRTYWHRYTSHISIWGWVAGILADCYGRVRTLQITIAWFAAFTFLCGFAQTHYRLLTCRAFMGFGFQRRRSIAECSLHREVVVVSRCLLCCNRFHLLFVPLRVATCGTGATGGCTRAGVFASSSLEFSLMDA